MMSKQNDDSLFVGNGVWRSVGADTFVRKHQARTIDAHELEMLDKTINPDGSSFLHWCISVDGDTLVLSKELSNFNQPKVDMKHSLLALDTMQPNSSLHASPTAFIPYYPLHCNPEKDRTDDVFQAAMFPVLVMITIAYLYRSVTCGYWSKLFNEIKA